MSTRKDNHAEARRAGFVAGIMAALELIDDRDEDGRKLWSRVAALAHEPEQFALVAPEQPDLDLGLDVPFVEFWKAYPNKVGKPAAERAYKTAITKRRHSPGAILAGLYRYIDAKPADRPWLNPATFLNQDRFLDQPAAQQATPSLAAAFANRNKGGSFADQQQQERSLSAPRAYLGR